MNTPDASSTIVLAFFKGRGFISAVIRWQTDGPYSHVAAMRDWNHLTEAWQFKGVQTRTITEWSDVDFYRLWVTVAQKEKFFAYLDSCVGMRYDYRGVLRFATRSMPSENGKKFCSELIMDACEFAGIRIFNEHVRAQQVDPNRLSWSTALEGPYCHQALYGK